MRGEDDVGAVHFAVWHAGRDEWEGAMGVDGCVRERVDHVFCERVACFHESPEVLSRRMDMDPSRMVARQRRFDV